MQGNIKKVEDIISSGDAAITKKITAGSQTLDTKITAGTKAIDAKVAGLEKSVATICGKVCSARVAHLHQVPYSCAGQAGTNGAMAESLGRVAPTARSTPLAESKRPLSSARWALLRTRDTPALVSSLV